MKLTLVLFSIFNRDFLLDILQLTVDVYHEQNSYGKKTEKIVLSLIFKKNENCLIQNKNSIPLLYNYAIALS